jgi:hypothetical protein
MSFYRNNTLIKRKDGRLAIGKNVNTSGEMIHKHYAKNLLTTDMIDQLTGLGKRRNLRLVTI